jgi:quinol monooxygenase YgiN
MIMYNIRVRANPGRGAELLSVFETLAAAAEQEPGTLLYVFNNVDDDPDLVVTYEVFADADAIAAHQRSAAVAAALERLGELVAESDALRGAPAFGKGLPNPS